MKKIAYSGNRNIIYRQLKIIRKHRGLSQSELAAKMQVLNISMDQQMISKIERNKRFVTDYELVCLCRILNVSEKQLLKDYYEILKQKEDVVL